MKIIVIGAPSLREAVEQSIAEQLDDVKFPLNATVENRMPRDISLPEMGLFLRHVCNSEGLSSQVVRVDDLSQIQRTAASIEQIAEMNNYKTAIIITVGEEVDADADADADADPDPNAGSGGGEGGGEDGNTNDPTSESTDDSTNGESGSGEANTDANKTPNTGTADANANTSTGADTKTNANANANANVSPKESKGKTKATKSTKTGG